jgi:hypothetical protein
MGGAEEVTQLVTVDAATGEVAEFRPREIVVYSQIRVPETIDETRDVLNHAGAVAFACNWGTAAFVYAWTYEGEPGRPSKNGGKSSQFTLRQFAALGIRGLSDRATVAKYRAAWQGAIDAGLAKETKPGELVDLPEIDFSSTTKLPANYSSESNEWYTPEEYIDSVREVLGCIDLDPASCEFANRTVEAARIFTETDDGLSREWLGRVFLNPPYGTTDDRESRAGAFCRKAIAEYQAGRVTEAIILVNSVHSQNWQRPLYSFPVCFVDHRIEFVDQNGTANPNPTFGNIFVYLGPNVRRFAEEFRRHGYCMEPML